MDINKHPIYKAIYELGRAIESLPASEQATKLSSMCSELQKPADLLYSQWQNAANASASCWRINEPVWDARNSVE